MADIDLTQVVYDPAVGVSIIEEMTADLLHKAVKNPLFAGYTWTPCYCNAHDLAGGITLYVPVILPGAKVEVCCLGATVLSSFDVIVSEDESYIFQSVQQFCEPMKSPGGNPPSVVLDAIAAPTRQVILRARETVRAFVCFYRLIGGE